MNEPKSSKPSGAVPTAEELRMQMLKAEMDNMTKQEQARKKAMQEHEQFAEDFLKNNVTEHERAVVQRLVRVAFEQGKTEASSPFEYAARLTEVMLLGIVALRAGTKINYDGTNMRITNAAGANDFLRREYRKGWSL